MPQMMPMNWLNLYIYSLIMIFIILIMIYFMNYNKIMKIKFYKKHLFIYMYKW